MSRTETTVVPERLTVAKLARRVGVRGDTIRYYEKAGLLPAPERSASDYRIYDEAAVDRLRFIQGAQRLGLRLREVKVLLQVRDTGQCPCEPAEQVLRGHITETDRELRAPAGAEGGPGCHGRAAARPGLSGAGAGDLAALWGEEASRDACNEFGVPVLRRSALRRVVLRRRMPLSERTEEPRVTAPTPGAIAGERY